MVNLIHHIRRYYALSWKPCQRDSLNLPDHRFTELISTRITLELANWAICTPAGIARDVFVPVGKFTFPSDFVIVDYESDPRVSFILGRPFLRTTRTLIDVHREEMILHDSDERLTLNMRHDTLSYLNQPKKESINMINIYDDLSEDFLENLCTTNHQSGNPTFSSHPKLTSLEVKDDVFDPEGGNPLSLSPIPVEDIDSFLEKSDTSLSYSDISLPEFETFINHTEETNSGSITTPANYSLPKYDLLLFEIEPDRAKFETFYFDIEEKDSGSTTIHAVISLLDLECFNFNDKPNQGELISSVDSGIHENVFLQQMNEDGISNYHFPSLLADVSHQCETFMKFNVYPKLLNESPMEILFSPYSLME
nr:reverse transcriptase domain-containing protein [Tanacetum cinerariifolium]